jgi:hypothetical protein
MAAGICLPPQVVDKFKQALVSGKIQPEQLANMTSQARHKLFSEVVGEGNAKFVNSTFEAKLLLKDKQAGFLRWAKKLTGISPEVRRDLISRIEKLDERILDPETEKLFLKDLAATKLGLDVTAREAKDIATMSKALQRTEAKRKPDGTFPTEDDRMAFGYAKVDLGEYLSDLKLRAGKESVKSQVLRHPIRTVGKVAAVPKSVVAALDNSALGRQGWKTLMTSPKIWQKNARQSFVDIVRQFGNKPVMREIKADIYSRPNADKYDKMKLALGNVEEEFPTSIQNKVPGVGRLFKASETAYEGFLYRTRADTADKMLQIAEKHGVDITDKKELESMGKLVNSLTGRGHLGRFENGEAPKTFNNLFFSIRFLKSNIDTLTAHQFQKDVTPFVRKQAAKNLVSIAAGTAAVLTIAEALRPGSVELDPRSSDFGKIKIGDTRFDVSGGMGSIITLAARIAGQGEKSSSGIIKPYNTGYGSKNGMDAFWSFFENKASPSAGVVRDLIKQKDFEGNKPTPESIAKQLVVPLPIQTNVEAWKDPNAANPLAVYIADTLGIGANTYGRTKRNTEKLGSTQEAFKKHVGEDKFNQANTEFENSYDLWLAEHRKAFDALPNDDKQPTITAVKNKIQKSIYKKYGFKPPKQEQSKARKSLLETVR